MILHRPAGRQDYLIIASMFDSLIMKYSSPSIFTSSGLYFEEEHHVPLFYGKRNVSALIRSVTLAYCDDNTLFGFFLVNRFGDDNTR